MKRPILVVAMLAMVIIACQEADKAASHLLNSSKLPSEFFVVNISRDTTLVTRQGALIKLPQGTLQASRALVKLEIKEAYSMQDIIRGGLTTTSNGQPLSSGGMIYLSPADGQEVQIKKPISIAVPTPFIDTTMQLYKGEVQKDGSINWTQPQALPPNPQQQALNKGKALFVANCATCHKIERALTGPGLAHATKKLSPYAGSKGLELLYTWTRNNSKVLASGDCYYNDLYEKWNKTPMSAFPDLSDAELDQLYAYIDNESYRLGIPVPAPRDTITQASIDSCYAYEAIAGKLLALKEKLGEDSNALVNHIFRVPPETPYHDGPEVDRVSPMENKGLYYQFTMETFGWYNIDVPIGTAGSAKTMLTVQIENENYSQFNLYLAVPSIRGLMIGGALKEEGSFGFDMLDGSIVLPQQVEAWVFAVGEKDTAILFASRKFTIGANHAFKLQLTPISRESFAHQVSQMGLPEFQLRVDDTKTGIELRKVIKELKSAGQLKPKNCDCDCILRARDTIPLGEGGTAG